MNRRAFVRSIAKAAGGPFIAKALPGISQVSPGLNAKAPVTIQVRTEATPFPHFWEECVGSDRAVVGLRQQWLDDLSTVQKMVGIKSVRFHGLFNDEMGVCPTNVKNLNFLYVDMVFDAMLARGVRPFVELSFMPAGLASGKNTMLWYKGNVSPPVQMEDWGELVVALASHCVDRYGRDEVCRWKFEVWNEPNIVFWSGTKEQYFELYRRSAQALKSVNEGLQIGGPATAEVGWIPEFLDFCATEKIPIDFVSTHIYPDDPQKIVFGSKDLYPYEDVIPKAIEQVNHQIKASRLPHLPLYLTEWGSQNPAFIAHTIKQCVGMTTLMSYWTFSNVYEELGVPKKFFNNGFGMIGLRGVPRPSFNTFALLHRLGQRRLATDEGPVLATSRDDGSIALLAWNLIPLKKGQHGVNGDPVAQTEETVSADGEDKLFNLSVNGHHRKNAYISRVDHTHGSATDAYVKMGSPAYPTVSQLAQLKAAAAVPPAEHLKIGVDETISFSVPANGVALIEIS